MKPYRPEWTLQARAQVEAAGRWWSENRGSDLLLTELDGAFALLVLHPYVGPAVLGMPGVPRILLKKTKHHIYYRVNEKRRELLVVAFWHTSRGVGPPL